MENYKQMYSTLFNAVTDAIEDIENANYGNAKATLMQAQQQSEEIFISTEDETK